jgi:molybdopterin-binding protein
VIIMKLSAHNKLKGAIVDVKKGATTNHVRRRRDRFDHQRSDRGIAAGAGETAYAVIKASDVVVGID